MMPAVHQMLARAGGCFIRARIKDTAGIDTRTGKAIPARIVPYFEYSSTGFGVCPLITAKVEANRHRTSISVKYHAKMKIQNAFLQSFLRQDI